MTGSAALAEEALQETYLRLIQAPAKFDPHRGHLLAFLFGVLRNVISGLHRQGRRFSSLDLDAHDSVACDSGPADAAVEQSQRATQLWAAIGTLPEHYREVLVLCDLEELDYEQAARLLARPVGTIRSRLNRARSLLKWKLAPEGEPQPERGTQQ
jgi:RNA polymerase sigma-70 factor (ECF subfamily)